MNEKVKSVLNSVLERFETGDIPYILLPGSNKYLYSVSDIIELEAQHKRTAKKVR